MYANQTITVAILQIKRKEWKITGAGLTNKLKVVLSQKNTWGIFIGFVCLSLGLFSLI